MIIEIPKELIINDKYGCFKIMYYLKHRLVYYYDTEGRLLSSACTINTPRTFDRILEGESIVYEN